MEEFHLLIALNKWCVEPEVKRTFVVANGNLLLQKGGKRNKK